MINWIYFNAQSLFCENKFKLNFIMKQLLKFFKNMFHRKAIWFNGSATEKLDIQR